ncbi:CvpA family protein [Pseudaquidulcibacter saccharophilus]|uniref:CvpA family protein n=1 Tax=Pseudaquidulcibacter saccharophilus TaxID=2831900 RepID=UPI001EFF433D|nr:CvpA family protein [Pseudaquidulcibacter saccharophilus]
MNGFDVLVLIIVGVSALLAFARGFVREFLSMTALALAILAVLWGLPVFRDPVKDALNTESWIANTITVITIFLLVYVAIRVLTGRIHEWVHDSEPLGVIDRTAGILFGVARGFVIISIAVITFISVAKEDKWPKILKDAKFFPFLVLTGDALKSLAPEATKAAIDTAVTASHKGEETAKKSVENGMKNAITDEIGKAVKKKDSDIPDFSELKEDKKTSDKSKNSEKSKSDESTKLKVVPK